jgi:peptidoglycan/LPS O-acetylase OafA/YrhL
LLELHRDALMTYTAAGYRPDIDGLRAIAVLAVILYHFAYQNLPGGYFGVDIFFVLSGYLITRIIHGEILAGRFTVRGFYERRIRRILPALLVLLAICSVIAVLILLPSDLVRFAKSLLAALAFGANIFAWRDTDYFSPLADQKPLLHTWSLGVEEQFYILFPLLLWVLAWRWPRRTLPVIVAITAASFALNILAHRFGAGTAAFYLLPTRAWELGVGAILALVPARRAPARATGWMSEITAGVGLALVAAALVAPGVIRLPDHGVVLAVAGTALLVGIGERSNTLVSRLLGAAPLVWIGLISYSLYLWHWPVIVFSKYFLVRELRPLEVAALWVLMVAAAALSWRFVERPFRRREFPVRRLYVGSAAVTAVLATAGLALLLSRGLPARLNPEAAVINEAVDTYFRCALGDRVVLGLERACALNLAARDPARAQLVLLGSSHAQMYAPVWREILEQRHEGGLLVSHVGCLPTVSANFDLGCLRLAQASLDAVNALPEVHTVVLAMTWWQGPDALVDTAGRRLDNREKVALIAAIDDLIVRLRAKGRRVVLVGPIAVPGSNLASIVSLQLAYGRPVDRPLAVPRSDFDREYAAVFRRFSGRDDVAFARPDLIQCDSQDCRFFIDGRALFSDVNHLAAAEVGRFRTIFQEALER